MRTDNLKLKVSPAPILTGEPRARVMVLSTALLNPLLPPGTSLIWPEPTTEPFLSTSASRSNFVPTSSLFLSPIQTLAGLSAVKFAAEFTVTVNWQVAWLFEVSVAVHVTVVVPTGKLDPDGGTQATVWPGQLSLLGGVGYVTVAEPDPGGFSSVTMFAGHGPIVGGSLSLTVTLKLHDWSGLLPFDAVHVTSVVPFGKVCGEVIVVG